MATLFDDADNTRYLERLTDVHREPQCWLMPIEGHERVRLVSLDEAIEPLIDIVPDIARKAYVAKQKCQHPAEGLSPDESAAIALYTMEWPPYEKCLYYSLNQGLRNQQREYLKPYYLFMKLFLVALDKLPSLSCTVFRGVKKDLIKKYLANGTCIWWGFSSCTTDVSMLQAERFLGKNGDRTMFSIECCSGKNLRQHSFYEYENEILLPPARYFKVIGSVDHGNGLHFIQLKETKPPVVLIEPASIEINLPLSLDSSEINHPLPISRTSKFHGKISKYQNSTNVNLTFEDLTDHDIPVIISQIIMFNVCTEIDLSNNRITSEGVSVLALALRKNKTLKVLSLLSNHVSDEGILTLAESLSTHDSTITTLGLGSNDINDEGAQYLAQMLQTNQTLTVLTLQFNHIGARGMELLMNALGRFNRSLQVLNVSSNTLINDSCVDSITSMLTHNETLKELYMISCDLSAANKTKINRVVNLKRGFLLRL
jgi:hypothetical protein